MNLNQACGQEFKRLKAVKQPNSQIDKDILRLSEELFNMAYGWGRARVVVNHTCNAWLDTVNELLAHKN